MKLKFLALCLVIALMATMLSSCEILKFTNHMLNIFGPEDDNNVNLDLDIVLPGNNSGTSGNGEHVHNWITIPGKPSTCTVNGYTEKIVCDTCGEVRVESAKIVLAPHTYDDSSDRICNVCAYVRACNHTYDDSYDRVCNICGASRDCDHTMTETIPGYPATESSEGLTDGTKCKFCNAIVVPQQTIPVLSTLGLTFKLSNDGKGYIVTGMERTDRSEIYISTAHNGLPIVGIGDDAFKELESLTKIVISDSVTSIGSGAFSSCVNLTNIIIGNGVTTIKTKAFYNCESLTSIVIPRSVKNIELRVFEKCSALESITVENGNTVYHSAGNCLIETASKTLIAGSKNSVIPTNGSVNSIADYAFYGNSIKSIVIPANVTSIGKCAFTYCESLTSIVIPGSVTSISFGTFFGCISLTSIEIPGSVTSIGGDAFYRCSSLTSIVIPDSVKSIGERAFFACTSLTSVVIPGSVTSIGDEAFSRCSSLTSITFKGTKAQWNDIRKGGNWDYNTGNYTVYCTDGTVPK